MGRAAFNVRYKSYSTGIMLFLFAIKTSWGTLVSPFFIFAHDGSFNSLDDPYIYTKFRYFMQYIINICINFHALCRGDKKTAADKEENSGGTKKCYGGDLVIFINTVT
jgi:hypothetical protein